MEDKELLNLFTDMARIHTAYVEHSLQHLNLRTGQGAILSALGERGACSQKELAEYRHVSAATISVMLRRMEKSGLILRAVSEDSKSNQISLTEEGRRVYRALNRTMQDEPGKVFAGLEPADKQAAERVFRTIADNLKNLTPHIG